MRSATRRRQSDARSSRAVALLVGVLLAAGVVVGWIYWHQSYVHGVESCVRCDVRREVDRRGPFWIRSDPESRAVASEPCRAHSWVPTGCWEQDGGFARKLPPSR